MADQTYTTISIPGYGEVDFPDTMTPEEMGAAAKKLHDSTPEAQKHEKAQGYLKQGVEHPLAAAWDTAKNAVRDVADTGMGVVNLAANVVPNALIERAKTDANTVAGTFGYHPFQQESTPNLDALKSIPKQTLEHFKQYGNEDDRAIMMREHPFQVATDIAGVGGLAKSGASAAGKIPRPTLGVVANTALDLKTGGLAGVARGAVRRGISAVRGQASKTTPKAPLTPAEELGLTEDASVRARDVANVDAPIPPRSPASVNPLNTRARNTREATSANDMLTPGMEDRIAILQKGIPDNSWPQGGGPNRTVHVPQGAELTPASFDQHLLDTQNNIVPRAMRPRQAMPPAQPSLESQLFDTVALEAQARHAMPTIGPAPQEIGGAARQPMGRTYPPPPPNPNAGGRLTRPGPNPSIIQRLLQPERVSIPETPQPPVNYSSAAMEAGNRPGVPRLEDMMRRRAQTRASELFNPQIEVNPETPMGVPAQTRVDAQGALDAIKQAQGGPRPTPSHPMPEKRASTVSTPRASSKPLEARYQELSRKPIRTLDEELEFQQLQQRMMATGARNRGMVHATSGRQNR